MRHTSRLVLGLFSAGVLSTGEARPDEIELRGGGRLRGVIVERTETKISIETGPGRVTLPMSRVERIVESRSALEVFAERAAGLAPGDAVGWAELARYAEERDLLTQAHAAWQRVLAVDPRHPEANAGLGRVSQDGVWMSADDAHRARGYVSYQGRWLTPAEHDAALRESAAERAAALEARESDMRVREAEARAREAEALAREAENAPSGGIPLDYAYGSGYGYGYGYGWGGAVIGPTADIPPHGTGWSPATGRRHPGGRHHEAARPGRPDRPARPATRPASTPGPSRPSHPPRSQAGIQPPPPAQPSQPRRR